MNKHGNPTGIFEGNDMTEFKENDEVWVKTRVIYLETYDDEEYPHLGLDSVTLWDLNKKENRENIKLIKEKK